MVWLEGGQGEVRGACAPPPAPQHPKSPHLEPPNRPSQSPPPQPLLDPAPHWALRNSANFQGVPPERDLFLSIWTHSLGMQQTDGLMHCIDTFACLHHLQCTIRSLYVSVYFRALGDVQQATDRS